MVRFNFSVATRLFLACALLFSTACSSGSSSATYQKTVPIGVLAPLTGDLREKGEGIVAALDVGLPQVNRRLAAEDEDFRIRLVVKDTASDPATARTALSSLRSEGVRIVIGPVSSAECEELLPVADSLGMIMISPGSTASSLAIADDNLFRVTPDDSNQGQGTAALMWEKGFKAMVPLWRGDVWGDGLEKSIGNAFQGLGGAVLSGARFAPGSVDYTAQLDAVANQVADALATYGEGNVAVVLISYPTEAVPLLTGAATRPSLAKAGWFGSDGITLSSVVTASAEASAFAAQTKLLSPIFSREDVVLPLKRIVLNDRVLREKISMKLGHPAETTALGAWDALWLAARAYTDSGEEKDAAALKTALRAAAFDSVGLCGALSFNDAGDMQEGNYGYYGVKAKNAAYAWELRAAYQFELVPTPKIVDVTEPTLKGLDPPSEEVKIGALLSLTGGQSYAGRSVRSGLNAALEEINRYFSMYGYPVKLSLEIIDTGTDPERALSGFNTLADKGIKFIVGPLSSAECLRVLPPANTRGVVLVSPSSNAMQLAVPNDNLLRFVPSTAHEAAGIALLLHEQGIDSLAIMARDDIWGADLAEHVGQEFQATGGTVLDTVTYSTTAGSYTTELTRLSNALAGAATQNKALLVASFDEITEIIQQASAFSALATARWYGGDGSARNEKLAATSEAAAYAAARGFTCPVESFFSKHANQKNSIPKLVVMDDIEEAYGGTPHLHAYSGWDSLWIMAITLMDSEWSSNPTLLRQGVISASDSYIGMSNFMGLDDNGDRKYGDYAFYTLTGGNTGYQWDLFATYHFHPVLYLPPRLTYP